MLWKIKMQTETAVSTMHAEYVALSTAMRDLLPFRTLFEETLRVVGLPSHKTAVIKTKVYEDNRGCKILAMMEPGRTTPNSKHFHVKLHWFREQLIPNEIEVVSIDSDRQLADIFTKGLRRLKFETNRNDLCGWTAETHELFLSYVSSLFNSNLGA